MTARNSIDIPGLAHGNLPIPTASKVGPLLCSGGIIGMDPTNGKIPEELVEQCRLMFENVATVMKTAGGTPNHIAKMTIWMADRSAREILNAEWLKMFPAPTSRPARHTLEHTGFREPVKIQCDITAYILA